jgi:hypothetical protein
MKTISHTKSLALLAFLATSVHIQAGPDAAENGPDVPIEKAAAKARVMETPAQHDDRMAWWREARFGMFIHCRFVGDVWTGQNRQPNRKGDL